MVDLPNWAWWVILLSPIWLTPLVSFPFVRQAPTKIGFWKASAISLPAALPLALLAVTSTFENDPIDSVGLLLLLLFGWISIGGPVLVELTQWVYVEVRRLLSKK